MKQMTYKDAAAAAEAAKGGAGEEPSSEYESIDPSIFGRVKAKIRKSQVTTLSLKYLCKCRHYVNLVVANLCERHLCQYLQRSGLLHKQDFGSDQYVELLHLIPL